MALNAPSCLLYRASLRFAGEHREQSARFLMMRRQNAERVRLSERDRPADQSAPRSS